MPTAESPSSKTGLHAAASAGDPQAFRAAAHKRQPADVADALAELPGEAARDMLLALPAEDGAEVLGYLGPERQLEIVAACRREQLVELVREMSSDERADLYNRLEEEHREGLMRALAQAEREDIRRLAAYEEGTVGAVMTSEYATLPPELTARQALEHLRGVAPDAETIYQTFVVDTGHRLLGTVAMRDLVLAPGDARVDEIMHRDVVTTGALAPRAEAAELIAHYDLLALPVVDDGVLVGIVTHDDAMDVAEAEATEDIHKVGSVEGIEGSIREAPLGVLYRKRIFWLVALVFANLFSGAGISYFEQTISAHLALLFFLPLLIASAGNAGAQSSTLMVRAMAVGDVELRDWGYLLGREFLVAALLGLTLALVVSAIGAVRAGPEITLVVSLTMVAVVLIGSLIGMTLPFVLSQLELDPAAASTPLVTSIADVTGVLIYFGIATAVLLPAGG